MMLYTNLIDGDFDVSLLTNWGNDVDVMNRALGPTALVRSFCGIRRIHAQLVDSCGGDAHVEGSRIVSICSIGESA